MRTCGLKVMEVPVLNSPLCCQWNGSLSIEVQVVLQYEIKVMGSAMVPVCGERAGSGVPASGEKEDPLPAIETSRNHLVAQLLRAFSQFYHNRTSQVVYERS